jgi:hypothetical protein
MIPPINGSNIDIASLTSQMRDAGVQQPTSGEIAAPAETSRPTPAPSAGDQAQLSTNSQSSGAPETVTLQSSTEAERTAASLRESLLSNPGSALLAQGGVKADPTTALLGSSPSVPSDSNPAQSAS